MFTVDDASDSDRKRLLDELNALQNEDLQVVAKVTTREAHEEQPTRELNISGMDQVGIISSLTQHLVELGINIHAMDYTIVNGPFTAAPIFNAKIVYSTPAGQDISSVHDGLRQLEQDIQQDLDDLEVMLR